MRNVKRAPYSSGFTLIELVLVMMVLAIVAGLVVPMIGGLSEISTPAGSKSEREIIVETTLRNVRDTFVSIEMRNGLWADMGHMPNRLPRTVGQMFLSTPPLVGTPTFDPITKIGWRGPYLKQPTGTFPDVTSGDWSLRNFSASYGNVGDAGLVDAWGNPIVLQIDFDGDDSITTTEVQVSRLVSAGANGVIDWALDENLTHVQYLAAVQADSVDDLVIYLRIAE